MINLEQDFTKFETNGDLAYYGYTNIQSSDSDNKWSIRLLTGTGSTFDVKWSNGEKLNFISKWSEKEDYFTYSPTASFGLTWSMSGSNLSVEWDDLPGYDIWKVSILNESGKLVNVNSVEIFNKWSEIFTEIINSNGGSKLNFWFNKPNDSDWTFKLESSKIGGKTSENFTF